MGNFIDPSKSGLFPMTEDMYIQQKKLRKESLSAKVSSPSLHQAFDMSSISDQARQQAEDTKLQDFKQSAVEDLSKLDSSSETFFEEATDRIVGNALEREFGKGMTGNKGFAKMKSAIMKQLLENDEQRAKVETFITDLMPSVHNFVYGEHTHEE